MLFSYSLFKMDNSVLRTALGRWYMNGCKIDFPSWAPSSPSFTTMNKFILVTCEYSRYLSSLLVL